MLLLPRCLAKIADLAGDSTRRSFTAIRVLEYAESYRLEVTDGHRLLIVRGPQSQRELTVQDRLTCESLEDATNGAFDALVPAEDWTKVFKVAKKGDNVGLVLSAIDVTLAAGSQLLKTRQVEGRYPPVDAVIPERPALWSVAVNPLLLAELLEVMAQVVGEDTRQVFLHYYGPQKPLGLSCMNAAGLFADAIIMPLM